MPEAPNCAGHRGSDPVGREGRDADDMIRTQRDVNRTGGYAG